MYDCEGWQAAWCPYCGDCTCYWTSAVAAGAEDDDAWDDYKLGDDPACPLHGLLSTHGEMTHHEVRRHLIDLTEMEKAL